MRLGLVIVGVVLAIIGGVLLYVPVVPQSSETINSASDTPYYVGSVSGYSFTGTIVVSVTWSSSTTVEVAAAACTSSCDNANASNSSVSDVTLQSGTSGSFTLNQPNNGYIIMGVISTGPATNATFHITTALATVGTVLVPVGIVLLIVGVVLRKKGSGAAAPAAPATPAAPPPDSSTGSTPPAAPPPSS